MFHWLIVTLYALVIFYISNQPSISFVPENLTYIDPQHLLLHLLEYIPLGLLIYRAVLKTSFKISVNPIYFSTLLGVVYGLSDEIHQYFVPGRTASPLDLAADSIGVLIGVFLWKEYRKSSYKKH